VLPDNRRFLSSQPSCGGQASLTDADRHLIAGALALAVLRGAAIREHTRERDLGMAMAALTGECQHMLAQLAAIAERLAG